MPEPVSSKVWPDGRTVTATRITSHHVDVRIGDQFLILAIAEWRSLPPMFEPVRDLRSAPRSGSC